MAKEKKVNITYWYVVWWKITLTTNRKPKEENGVWFEFDEIIEMKDDEYKKFTIWDMTWKLLSKYTK